MKSIPIVSLLILISFQTMAQQSPADSLKKLGLLKEATKQYAIQYVKKH